jgi:hypothetical protein
LFDDVGGFQHTEYRDIELNFKIGVLKELHKRQLITREDLDKVIAGLQHKATVTIIDKKIKSQRQNKKESI